MCQEIQKRSIDDNLMEKYDTNYLKLNYFQQLTTLKQLKPMFCIDVEIESKEWSGSNNNLWSFYIPLLLCEL